LFGGRQLAFEFGWEFGLELVFRHADGVAFGLEGKLDFEVVFLRAENDADGRAIVGARSFSLRRFK
jgi:hypothetical protein